MIDTQTYNNFKAANPNLTPDARDYANMAGTGPDVVSSPTVPTTISSSNLTATSPIVLPQQDNTSTASSLNTSVSNPIPTADSIINAGATPTLAEIEQKTRLQKIADFIGLGKTKTELQNQADSANGVSQATTVYNELNTQLEGLNNQALDLQNQARPGGAIENKQQNDILSRGITTTAGLAPLTAGDLRKNQIQQSAIASQALTVKSALFGAQGKLSLAKDAADKAATAQFEKQQQQIDYQKAQLEALMPTLNKEEKARAAIQQAKLADRQMQLDNAKEDKKTILALATAALKNNPNDPQAQYNAQQALAESNKQVPDVQKALALVGKYQSDPIAVEQATANLAKTRLEMKKLNSEIVNNGVPPITNPEAGKYTSAISTILGSNKFTAQNKRDFVNAVNTGGDPFVVIKNQARDIMSPTNKTDTEKYETIRTQMQSIDAQLKDYYANGGKTNIFSGNLEKTINRLGQVDDPNLVEIASNISSSLQAYRNAISGTAYSEQEGKDIAAIFPGINKSEGLNQAIINGRMKFIDTTIDAKYRGVLGSTYDTLKGVQSNQTANVPSSTSSQDVQMVGNVKYVKGADDLYYPEQQAIPTVAPVTPTKPLLPDLSGYKGFSSFNSIFK